MIVARKQVRSFRTESVGLFFFTLTCAQRSLRQSTMSPHRVLRQSEASLNFVLQMKRFHETLGSLKNADEVGYETGLESTVGKTQVLLYKLEYEHGNASERLTLVRSPTGEMQLWKMDLQPAD